MEVGIKNKDQRPKNKDQRIKKMYLNHQVLPALYKKREKPIKISPHGRYDQQILFIAYLMISFLFTVPSADVRFRI